MAQDTCGKQFLGASLDAQALPHNNSGIPTMMEYLISQISYLLADGPNQQLNNSKVIPHYVELEWIKTIIDRSKS